MSIFRRRLMMAAQAVLEYIGCWRHSEAWRHGESW